MNTTITNNLAAYIDDPIQDPFDTCYSACLEISEDHATYCHDEELTWHLDHFEDAMALITDTDGYLTREAMNMVEDLLTQEIHSTGYNVQADYIQPENIINISISFAITPEDTLDTVIEKAWNPAAAITNMTDPGTFGCDYLFGAIARSLR